MTKHTKNLPHSSSISCCEYDDATKDMHITFASGGKHCFKDVEKEHYDNIDGGKYFHQHLRRKYISIKID